MAAVGIGLIGTGVAAPLGIYLVAIGATMAGSGTVVLLIEETQLRSLERETGVSRPEETGILRAIADIAQHGGLAVR